MVKFTSHSGGHARPKTCNAILGAAQHITFGERAYECLSESNFCVVVCSFPFFVFKPETMPPVIMLAAVRWEHKTLQQFNPNSKSPVAPSGFIERWCNNVNTKTQTAITWIIIWIWVLHLWILEISDGHRLGDNGNQDHSIALLVIAYLQYLCLSAN